MKKPGGINVSGLKIWWMAQALITLRLSVPAGW